MNLVMPLIELEPYPDAVNESERAVHLVDIENLLGSSDITPGAVRRVRGQYDIVAGVTVTDHLIIATGPTAAPAAWFGWGSARRLLGRGIDGADRALLAVIEAERLAARFSRVVIASGDGIFAEASAALQAGGCQVTVVTRPGSLSTRLRLAVRDVRYLYDSVPVPPLSLNGLRRAA